jgi:negative regulator of replication initiation
MKTKTPYPQIRISRNTHIFLSEEIKKQDVPSITEFIELLVVLYKERPDLFNNASGGILGRTEKLPLSNF